MKNRKKKLVDLIFLENVKPESQLKIEYESRINTWMDWLERQQNDESLLQDAYIEEQTEFYLVNNVLKNFIRQRLDWILNSVADPDLRRKYLSVFIPFSQQGSLNRFLTHFFQLVEEDSKQERLKFQFLTKSERELKILWDIYKLTKTIESITTLKKAAESSISFPSIFSSNYIQEVLSTLSDIAHLLINICIKPMYQKSVLEKFPLGAFKTDMILKRKEADAYLVADIVLEKYDYRNYLFYIYFRPNLKAIYQDEELSFKFNYLDYEIIRQEFLMDWISVRLKNNPKKYDVFEKYMFGEKSFNQVVEANPKMELKLLKELPTHVFNDLISSVNESIDEKDKLAIDPMSEKTGAFAQQFKQFNLALEFAQNSLKKLKQFVLNPVPKPSKTFEFPFDLETEHQPEEKATVLSKILLKKNEIAFPYFCEQSSLFSKQHAFFKTKLGSAYKAFQSRVVTHLIMTPESQLIARHTPRHEWVTAYIIDDHDRDRLISYLLILGADLKTKPLSMGYASKVEDKYRFKPYFVFGCNTEISGFGVSKEERTVKGNTFFIYDFSNQNVIDKVLEIAASIYETR